jgi:LacI family transcriptional regulator
MRAILDAGLRVPEDVALVGCGNLHYDVFLRIPLTSVDQQSFAIGERAATLAIAMIDAESQGGPKPKGKSILLQPKLIIRESTYRKIRV